MCLSIGGMVHLALFPCLSCEACVHLIQDHKSPLETFAVSDRGHRNSIKQEPYPLDLWSLELPVLQIHVVNDLYHLREPVLIKAQSVHHDLKGASVSLVGILHLEHVEPDLAGFPLVRLSRDESEPGTRVDKASHQPVAGDPVDVHAFA